MPAMETRNTTIDLTALDLVELPVKNLLQEQKIFDLEAEMEEMGLKSDFRVFAAAASIGAMCENFWIGSTRLDGVYASPMFQLACDSAAHMIGKASQEFAMRAAISNGKVLGHEVITNTEDQHSVEFPEWTALSLIKEEGGAPCFLWGFEPDVRALGVPRLRESQLN